MDVTFVFFVITVVIASYVKQKVRVASLFSFFSLSSYSIIHLFYSNYPVSHIVLGSSPNPEVWSNDFIILLSISTVLLFSLLWSVWILFDKQFGPLIVICAGFLSRMIMSFSPTIFVSGYRTMSIFYFTMIFVILFIWDKIISKNIFISKVFTRILVLTVACNVLFFVFLRTY